MNGLVGYDDDDDESDEEIIQKPLDIVDEKKKLPISPLIEMTEENVTTRTIIQTTANEKEILTKKSDLPSQLPVSSLIAPPITLVTHQRVLGSGIKNTMNGTIFELANIKPMPISNTRVTSFIPSSLRRKKVPIEKPTKKSDDVVKETSNNTQKRKLESLNLFPAQKRKIASDIGMKPILLKDVVPEDEKEEPIQVEEEQNDNVPKYKEFNVNEFYKENEMLIREGKLSSENNKMKNVKSRTNQLSGLIQVGHENSRRMERGRSKK